MERPPVIPPDLTTPPLADDEEIVLIPGWVTQVVLSGPDNNGQTHPISQHVQGLVPTRRKKILPAG